MNILLDNTIPFQNEKLEHLEQLIKDLYSGNPQKMEIAN